MTSEPRTSQVGLKDEKKTLAVAAADALKSLSPAAMSKVITEAHQYITDKQRESLVEFCLSFPTAKVSPYDGPSLIFKFDDTSYHSVGTLVPLAHQLAYTLTEATALITSGLGFNLHTMVDPVTEMVSIRLVISPLPNFISGATAAWVESCKDSDGTDDSMTAEEFATELCNDTPFNQGVSNA